jgi:hypothetical protein
MHRSLWDCSRSAHALGWVTGALPTTALLYTQNTPDSVRGPHESIKFLLLSSLSIVFQFISIIAEKPPCESSMLSWPYVFQAYAIDAVSKPNYHSPSVHGWRCTNY